MSGTFTPVVGDFGGLRTDDILWSHLAPAGLPLDHRWPGWLRVEGPADTARERDLSPLSPAAGHVALVGRFTDETDGIFFYAAGSSTDYLYTLAQV